MYPLDLLVVLGAGNLALLRPALQAGTYGSSGSALMAVDGNTNQTWLGGDIMKAWF